MLTGRRMFEGETISHVLAAVLTKEPDLAAVPASVRHLLARCLEKDPKKRLRDIGDAMSLVWTGADQPVATTASSRQRIGSLAGWVTAGVIAAAALLAWPPPATVVENSSPVARFSIPRTLPPALGPGRSISTRQRLPEPPGYWWPVLRPSRCPRTV